jgi:hypothetical protein
MSYDPAYNVFNGSTLNFDGDAVAALEDIEWHVGGQKVDIGSALDALMNYGQGLDDVEVSITIKGTSTIQRGDTGDLSVSWNTDGGDSLEGNSGSLVNVLVNDVVFSGSKNGPITTKLQFVPAPEDD